MGFQGSGESEMLRLKVTSSKHKRSKSFPHKQRDEEDDGLDNSLEESNRIKLDMRHLKNSVKTQKKQCSIPSTEAKSSLKEEILQLEKRLQDQFEIRRAVETALGHRTSSDGDANETSVSISKPATELIKEIAVLELEVVYLEQYLLSLYRKAFDKQVSSISPSKRDERLKTPVDTPSKRYEILETPVNTPSKRYEMLETPVDTPSKRHQMLETPVDTPSKRHQMLETPVDTPSKRHQMLQTPVDTPSKRYQMLQTPVDTSSKRYQMLGTPVDTPSKRFQMLETPVDTPSKRYEILETPVNTPSKRYEMLETPVDTPSKRHQMLETPVDTPSKRHQMLETPVDTPSKRHQMLQTPVDTPSKRYQMLQTPVDTSSKRYQMLGTPVDTPSKRFQMLETPVDTPSKRYQMLETPVDTSRERFLEVSRSEDASKVKNSAGYRENSWKKPIGIVGEKLLDSSVNRCHSSLSQCTVFPSWASPPDETLADKAVRACHSQPLSMLEFAAQNANIISLAEHLGTNISDHVQDTPNKLSEDVIKCMSDIYCKLADPPLIQNSCSSPNSSMSSASAFSPPDQHDMWSPGFRNNSSFDVRLDNPFHVEGLKEFSGPYSTMLEVPWIFRDSHKLADVEHLLQKFRSLICRLEEVDPRKLRHEEKLAFWINIHNSLVMHAFLAYGIPQSNVKRFFLLLKAAYNIGGRTISADTIQSSILGCRMSRPGQWLRLLIPSKAKFKTGDRRQGYAIEHPEPLLHFALCSGNHSDPAVRVYTPPKVFQELETAKQEYIRATFGVRKDLKILLPKMVESFAKDSSLCPAGILEMVQQSLPEPLRRNISKHQVGKSRKSIEWIPHDFTFRYLISKELVR